MAQSRELLELTAALAADYLESLPSRPVFPNVQPDELRATLGGPLQDGPLDAAQVISELAGAADAGIVASGSGRFLGEGASLRRDVTLAESDPYGRGWLYGLQGHQAPDTVDVHGYVAILDATMDKMLASRHAGAGDHDEG